MSSALIFGASKGAGKAIADLLAKNKYDVALASRSIDLLTTQAKNYGETYGIQAIPLQIDLMEDTSLAVKKTIDEAVQKLGGLDVVIYTAGEFKGVGLGSVPPVEYVRALEYANTLFFMAPAYALIWSHPHLAKHNGSFVTITSDAGLESKIYPGQAPYKATKAAMNQFSDGAAADKSGVRIFALAPGNFVSDTLKKTIGENPGFKKAIEEKYDTLESFYHLSLKPEDVAQRVYELLTNPNESQGMVHLPSPTEF